MNDKTTEKTEKNLSPIYDPAFLLKDIKADYQWNMGRPSSTYTKKDRETLDLIASAARIGIRDALLVTKKDGGKGGAIYLLDAGFRRHYVASELSLEKVPVLIYPHTTEQDRRERNVVENAGIPVGWRGQASLARDMSKAKPAVPWDRISALLARSEKYVKQLVSTLDRLDKIDEDKIPAKEIAALSIEDAQELLQFKGDKQIDAWNEFQESGTWPSRKKATKGRQPASGHGKQKAYALLTDKAPWIEWAALGEVFPPKTDEQIDKVVAMVTKYRREAEGFDWRKIVTRVSEGNQAPAAPVAAAASTPGAKPPVVKA